MILKHDDLHRLNEGKFLNDSLSGFFIRYLDEYNFQPTNLDLAERVQSFDLFRLKA